MVHAMSNAELYCQILLFRLADCLMQRSTLNSNDHGDCQGHDEETVHRVNDKCED